MIPQHPTISGPSRGNRQGQGLRLCRVREQVARHRVRRQNVKRKDSISERRTQRHDKNRVGNRQARTFLKDFFKNDSQMFLKSQLQWHSFYMFSFSDILYIASVPFLLH